MNEARTRAAMLRAYNAWQAAADRGYGPRCNTPGAIGKVDARIRRLKARYEELAVALKKFKPKENA